MFLGCAAYKSNCFTMPIHKQSSGLWKHNCSGRSNTPTLTHISNVRKLTLLIAVATGDDTFAIEGKCSPPSPLSISWQRGNKFFFEGKRCCHFKKVSSPEPVATGEG